MDVCGRRSCKSYEHTAPVHKKTMQCSYSENKTPSVLLYSFVLKPRALELVWGPGESRVYTPV